MSSSRPDTDDDTSSYISDGCSIASSEGESTDTSSSFGKALRASMMRGIGGFYGNVLPSPINNNNDKIYMKHTPLEDDLSTASSHTAKSDFSQRTPIPTSSAPLEGLPNTVLGRNRSTNNASSSLSKAMPTNIFPSDEEDASRIAQKIRQDVNIDRLVVAAKQQQSFAQAWFAAASTALNMNALPAYSKRKNEGNKATLVIKNPQQKQDTQESLGHPMIKCESSSGSASINRPIDMDSGDVWSESSTISSCYSRDVPLLQRVLGSPWILLRSLCCREGDASKKNSCCKKYKRAFQVIIVLVIIVAISVGTIIHRRSHSTVPSHIPSMAPTLSPRNDPLSGQTHPQPFQNGNKTSRKPTRAPILSPSWPSLSPSQVSYNSSFRVWSQIGPTLLGLNRTDQFGYSVSLNKNGSMIAVGTRHYSDSRTFNGAVVVYRMKRILFQGILWEPIGQILTGRNALDDFGYSVSLSEDGLTLAVSEPVYTNGTNKNCGGVRVFRFDTTLEAWYQLGGDLYGISAFEYFGTSVSLSASGLVVAISSPFYGPFKSGCVRIFRYLGTSNAWIQLGLDLTSSNPYDNFGRDVSISGDALTVACGAPNNSNGGYVRIFRWDNSSIRWRQLGSEIRTNTSSTSNNFGWSVSLSYNGERLIVGTPNVQVQGLVASGSASVYSWDIISLSWVKNGNDLIGDPRSNQNFGLSVSITYDGNRVAVSAPSNDIAGYLSGQVSIYQWLNMNNSNTWIRSPSLFGETNKEQFGWDVALSNDGNSLAVGSPTMWDNLQSGKAKVFSITVDNS